MPSDFIQTVDCKVLPEIKPKGRTSKSLPQTTLTRTQLIETVASVLEGMIEERCTRYAEISEIPAQTMFHAKKLPSLSIKDYLNRFATYSNCHEDAFIYALIYLDKVGENLNEFSLDTFNVHR